MDPLTHALVGSAVAVMGGADVSLSDPKLIAATLGAVSPDLDIIYQYWGDYAYLKNHRGFSHSIPGLVGLAALIGFTLAFFYSTSNFIALFYWAFLGTLTHTFLDLMNSYGVMLLYPFSRKKYTLNLLMIYDPVIIFCCLAVLYLNIKGINYYEIFAVICLIYIFGRFLMRRKAEKMVKNYYKDYLDRLIVMPAFIGLFQWDFIAKVNNKNIVGQINLLSGKIKIYKKLKLIAEEFKEVLEKTKIAKIFKEFTPLFHIDYEVKENKLIGKFIDLRYYVRNQFLHQATVVLNKKNLKVEKALFQPYHPNNKIEIL